MIDDGPSDVTNINAYDETPVETSGFDVPSPVTSFSEIDFSPALIDNIKRCKFVKPTPIQRYAIPVAMAGRDLMACAQTGSGKTAAFCFPIINRILSDHHHLKSPTKKFDRDGGGGGLSLKMMTACPLALILAPTRELSCQVGLIIIFLCCSYIYIYLFMWDFLLAVFQGLFRVFSVDFGVVFLVFLLLFYLI